MESYNDVPSNQPYFYPFFKQSTSPMNMPFDIINQIELDYIINDNIITVSNCTFDITKKYYIYAYKQDGSFLTISEIPLTTNSFKSTFTQEVVKMVVIGEVRNDSKNVSLIKLVPLSFAISRAIIKKNNDLENEVIKLKNKVDELELKLNLIYEKLLIG